MMVHGPDGSVTEGLKHQLLVAENAVASNTQKLALLQSDVAGDKPKRKTNDRPRPSSIQVVHTHTPFPCAFLHRRT